MEIDRMNQNAPPTRGEHTLTVHSQTVDNGPDDCTSGDLVSVTDKDTPSNGETHNDDELLLGLRKGYRQETDNLASIKEKCRKSETLLASLERLINNLQAGRE